MQSKFTQLSFIIGSFFLVVSLILLIGYFTSSLLHIDKNMYAGLVFLLFGLMMILITPKR